MKPWGMAALLVAGLGAGAIALVNSGPEGDQISDNEAKSFVQSIGQPAGNNADDYVRAALEDPFPSYVAVLEATNPPTAQADDDLRASLLFLISHTMGDIQVAMTRTVNACYRADFNRYGVMNDGPERVDCPEYSNRVTPPPMPEEFFHYNYYVAMKTTMSELPATTGADEALATLRAKLPSPPTNPVTKAPAPVPDFAVGLRNGDIGLAAQVRSEQFGQQWVECEYVVRTADGNTTAWQGTKKPQRAGTVQCTPEYALDHARPN